MQNEFRPMGRTRSSALNRIWRVLLLLACLVPLIATTLAEAKDDDDYEQLYSTPDKFVEVWSDHEINQSRCQAICERVRKAYMFDNQQESWRNQDLLFKTPLKIRVVNSSDGLLGYAQGPNLFVVQDDYLDDELSEGTLAHELTHIQDARQLQGGKLPSFMLEGRALTNGHNYRMSIGQADNKYDRGMADSAMRYTSEDAQERLSTFHEYGWDMQAMGTFLVEYMRTKWNGGVSTIHPRLSRMVERIAGGAGFETAFEQEFGTPFESLIQSFRKYLDQTSENPETRLQGTMWQTLSATSAPSAAGDDDD